MGVNNITVTGRFYSLQFRNQEDGSACFYIVPENVMPEAQDGLLKCVGKIKLYAKGMPIEVTGVIKGNTLKVSDDHMPIKTKENTISILEYITKDLTECQKNAIAEKCENDLIQFCQDDENLAILGELLKRSTNGEAIAKLIFRRVNAIASANQTESLLLGYGVPFDKIMKMIKHDITIKDIKKNPYLVFSKYDIPVRIADVFARRECQTEIYDPMRIKGLVYATLKYILESGNTCCTIDQIERTLSRRFKDIQGDAHFGKTLINSCIMDMPTVCQYHDIDGVSYIYTNHVWEEETIAIQNLMRLKKTKKLYNCTIGIEDTEKEIGIHYNSGQRQAFELLKTSGVKILTGPPGSGKTAVVNGLIHNFEANENGTIHLAATTGMAAKVMHGATQRDSETVNMMLRVLPFNDTVKGRDLNDPVDADLIIVDEVSMMGLQLFSVLMQASRNGSIVILVGDENQLQSVDYGNILHDLISSGLVEVCRLTEILRQSGSICQNAARVNSGVQEMEIDSGFCIKECAEDNIRTMLLADYDPYASQIICPIKNGGISTSSINQMIQEEFNGDNDIVAIYGKRTFRLQDKIIMTKTNYDKGYINGDIGYIIDKTKTGELVISYHGGVLYIDKDDYCNMELAYAITIHKSQGSEFPKIHIVLPEGAANMMTRRLLYTAITRARKAVEVYAQGNAFCDAVMDKAEKKRYTLLKHRFIAACAPKDGGK